MSRRQYLKDRAAKAERLAQTIMDTLTVQRLREIATEFRAEAEQFSTEGFREADPPEASADRHPSSILSGLPHKTNVSPKQFSAATTGTLTAGPT
jgi:hypothetical protein